MITTNKSTKLELSTSSVSMLPVPCTGTASGRLRPSSFQTIIPSPPPSFPYPHMNLKLSHHAGPALIMSTPHASLRNAVPPNNVTYVPLVQGYPFHLTQTQYVLPQNETPKIFPKQGRVHPSSISSPLISNHLTPSGLLGVSLTPPRLPLTPLVPPANSTTAIWDEVCPFWENDLSIK